VVGVFWGLSSVAKKLTASAVGRLTPNQQLVGLACRVARIAVVGAGLFFALGILELEKTVMSLLAGVGVIGVALGFAFQDIASNFMSGVLMAFRQPFALGDFIATGGHEGTVEAIDLRSTTLLRLDGVHVDVPNAQVFGNPLVNYTRRPPRRVEVAVGVAYGSDLKRVRQVCSEVVDGIDNVLADQPVQILFTGFGASSIDLVVRFWTDNSRPGGWLASQSELIERIHEHFGAAGIEIPFPIRTLDLPKAHVQDVLAALPSMGRVEGLDVLPNK
jgi:small conductance mechanosensitive channel